ncbi:MAG TPA: hypothetical protein VNK44_06220 [Candidatus Nitrosotenuis sp.]|nr:hypothetical protein [Candidatus Nitrosotenuis sp.]
MKIALAVLAVLASACLLGQAASGFSPKAPQGTLLVVLSECDTGHDCQSKTTIKRTTSYTINLKESLNMDSNDKKPSDKKDTGAKSAKKAKEEKKPVKKEKQSSKKLSDDLKKKFEQIKKKPKKDSQKTKLQTKHDTVKNSISNIR